MKLIIDIKDDIYNLCKTLPQGYRDEVIANGTPLPKGHGRLIDSDALDKSLKKEQEDLDLDDKLENAFFDGLTWAREVLSKEPTIIEADKGD